MNQLVDRDEYKQDAPSTIPRRDFLKVAGLSLAALAAFFVAGPNRRQTVAVLKGVQVHFKWDSHGKISASRDAGETWQLVADFGPEMDINQVKPVTGGLIAEMYYRGYRISDGASIDLYDVRREGGGFVAVNDPDDARYAITPAGSSWSRTARW